jgi:Ca-activated chloride channel family protein
VQSYRLLGYENRLLATEDFDDDAKDAGEIGAGHTVTAFYELVPAGIDAEAAAGNRRAQDPPPLRYQQTVAANSAETPDLKLSDAARRGELLTLSLRYKQPEGSESTKLEFRLPAKAVAFDRASRDFQFASSVALFGMLLRQSGHADVGSFATVEAIAGGSLGQDADGYRREFLELVRTAGQLSARRD